ncbi:MAG: hypothetical protein ACLUHN_07875 [Evtepia gabavorous]
MLYTPCQKTTQPGDRGSRARVYPGRRAPRPVVASRSSTEQQEGQGQKPRQCRRTGEGIGQAYGGRVRGETEKGAPLGRCQEEQQKQHLPDGVAQNQMEECTMWSHGVSPSFQS